MRAVAIRRLELALFAVIIATSMSVQSRDKSPREADAVFLNGNIYVGAKLAAGLAPASDTGVPVGANSWALSAQVLPRAQAIAVQGGRVLAVGTTREIEKLRGKHTRVIDLHGHFVMPGFNDAHLHLALGGLSHFKLDLAGTSSRNELLERVAAAARSAPAGEWVRGRGWDQTKWRDQQLPSRQELDAVTGDHPAFLVRIDGHLAVANSAALRAAGISRNTPDPPGGKIDRDAKSEPTGILREGSAMELVNGKIPPPTPSLRRRAIELALAEAARAGVTSVQDSGVWEDFLVYEELEQDGKLTARIYAWQPFDTPLAILQQHRAHHPATDPLLRFGMLKGYLDGTLGSRTAALLAPYADDPGSSGLLQYDSAKLNLMADERAAAGFQLGFHAIGDRAAELALDAFEEAERYLREHDVPQQRQPRPLPGAAADAQRDSRFRIEHDQVVTPSQIVRFRRLGVIASVQPSHLLTDMGWAEARLGPERARHSYPWREFLSNGVLIALGTDYPVEPITPFRGIYAAVTRQNETGSQTYYPEQKLTIDETLAACTWAPAYAEFAENEKGTLEPGMLADFVVLDRDLTRVPPREILGTRVLRTVMGGNTVFESAE